jgi:hypothetical protein
MLYNQLPIKILVAVYFVSLHPPCFYKESNLKFQQFLSPFNKGTYFAPHLHNIPISPKIDSMHGNLVADIF